MEHPFVNYGIGTCDKYDSVHCKGISNVRLQCGHSLCKMCLQTCVQETYGDDTEVISVDKRKIYHFDLDDSDKTAYYTMMFSRTSKTLKCPFCDCRYSLTSPIYRDFGIPKRVDTQIIFSNGSEKVTYNVSTLLDVVHLLSARKQFKILNKINYYNEELYVSNIINPENDEIYELKKQKPIYVAIKTSDKLFKLMDNEDYNESYEMCDLRDFYEYLLGH